MPLRGVLAAAPLVDVHGKKACACLRPQLRSNAAELLDLVISGGIMQE